MFNFFAISFSLLLAIVAFVVGERYLIKPHADDWNEEDYKVLTVVITLVTLVVSLATWYFTSIVFRVIGIIVLAALLWAGVYFLIKYLRIYVNRGVDYLEKKFVEFFPQYAPPKKRRYR